MSVNELKLGGKIIGGANPCFIIAEVGLAHEGSLGMAFSYIDAAAAAGADAVKFQTHLAEFEGTEQEVFRVNAFPQDRTRREYWKRTAFKREEWLQLKKHCDEKGVIFLSSPFSLEAVDLLEDLGVCGWKIASGESTNLPLIEKIIETQKPILLSTGMSRMSEISQIVEHIKKKKIPLLLFQCTNKYPCPPESMGLNLLSSFAKSFEVPVGLSDHSGKTWPAIVARSMGASAVEVHITFHKKSFGPDVSSSLTLEEFGMLVDSIRSYEKAMSIPVDKDVMADELKEIRNLFTKSIVAADTLEIGEKLTQEKLKFKKPGLGIPALEYKKVLGKTLTRTILRDELLAWEDIE